MFLTFSNCFFRGLFADVAVSHLGVYEVPEVCFPIASLVDCLQTWQGLCFLFYLTGLC